MCQVFFWRKGYRSLSFNHTSIITAELKIISELQELLILQQGKL
ncbi:hypothetical protein PCIT_a0194 [Pseudoalteromonas citrea]|uniref:Uncharacterized protein n=1 Tax=Pseudoalteromonas citrea TaxID=43655 RepID=A0AAD4FSS5_9GAMM|nr:hypothetical protein PCIT_a0194 [Pseudoalteromonas citrea]